MNHAKAFRILRAASGLTQGELARLINIGPSQLSLIEAGKRQPSLKTIDSISQALSVPHPLISLLATDSADMNDLNGDISVLSTLLLKLLLSVEDDRQEQFDKAQSEQ